MLKLFPDCVVKKLTDCLNKILHSAVIPSSWLECRVIAIQKPHKPLNDINAKRAISIFGKIRRIFETLILRKMEKWAEIEGKIAKTQFGFRRGKSVRDCVGILMADIKIAFNEKKIVAAVLLDVQSAYDNVNVEVFITHLNEIGAPSFLCKLLWNLMKTRKNIYEVNGQIVGRRTSHVGFAQGLPLSPIEYNLATNQLENCLENGVQCIQLADDIIIYCATKDPKIAEAKINKTINNLMRD